MVTTKYPRGSEWRKWDLHLHTTCSYDYQYNGDDADELLVESLKNNNVSAACITDHFVINQAKIEKLRSLAPEIVFFPGVELRTDKGDTNIHVILIFDVLSNLSTLSEDFNVFKRQKGKCIDNDKRIYWDFNDIIEFAKGHEALLTIHAGRKTNGVDDRITNSLDHNQAVKEEFATYIDIFEMGQVRDLEDYHKHVFPSIGVKPMIICSDNHDPRNYNPSHTLWIKADPTFEGLKQIIYEPEDRVRIQEMNPNNKAGYQVIDTIVLNEPGFWNGELYMNPYLNTIIGGRSTGKSTLLQCVAKKLGQSIGKDEDTKKGLFIKQHYDSISIKWKDGEIDTPREIMFFPQNHMIDLASDPKELNSLLEKIVNEKDRYHLLDEYKKFLGQAQITISGQVNQLFLEQSKINNQIALKKQKGDEKGIESEILKITKKIEKIKSDSQISEDEIRKYNELTTSIAQKQGEIKIIESDIKILNEIVPENLFNSYFKNELDSLSEGERTKLTTKLEEIKKIALENWIHELSKEKEFLQSSMQKKTQEVESIQNADIYKKGFEYFQKNKEYRELQEQLKVEVEKLASIKELDKIIQQLKINIDTLVQSIIDNHFDYYNKLIDLKNNLLFEYSDISISLKRSLKVERLRSFLEERHNLRGYGQGYIDNFVKEYKLGHIKEITKQYLIDALSNQVEYKGGYVANNVVSELLSTNWFGITYNLEYEKDSFDDMSQGKKSFVILKLLLDFSDKKCPILLDQPEDSLDNRAIYNELVEYLRKKKLDRQLIIVTHNSNVVVSADSENVIVANQNGTENRNRDSLKFQYVNGALENTMPKNYKEELVLESQGIREHVCEILEGGIEAFKKREQKYGI